MQIQKQQQRRRKGNRDAAPHGEPKCHILSPARVGVPVPPLLPLEGQRGWWAKGKPRQALAPRWGCHQPSCDGHLRLAGPAALRGHRLELCPKNNSAQQRRELQSTRRTIFFFFPFFHAPSQCNICSGGLSKEKARC